MRGYKIGGQVGWFSGEKGCLIKMSVCDKINTEYTELCGIQILKFIASIHVRKL